MRRFFPTAVVLLTALPGFSADVPLSDVALAPLPATAVAAAASDQAVLAVYVVGDELYAQRLQFDGKPIDPLARFLAPARHGFLAVLWDRARWVVVSGSDVFWIDHDGTLEARRFLPGRPVAAAVIADRVEVVDWVWARPGLRTFRVYEVQEEGEPSPSRQALAVDASTASPARFNGATGLALTQTLRFSTSPTEAMLSIFPAGSGEPKTVNVAAPSVPFVSHFVPNRTGGGLFVWNDGGLNGLLVRPDGSFSAPFAIGPRGAISSVRTAPREDGWNVLWLMGESAHTARISDDATVEAHLLGDAIAIAQQTVLVAVPDGGLVLEPRQPPASGIDVRTISGAHVGTASIVAYEKAFQGSARSASGGGFELVVWGEQGADGIVLKATRIAPTGLPLDGAGLIVASTRVMGGGSSPPNAAFSVAFDGEAFVVAWIRREADYGRSVLMRRISTEGALHPERFLGDAPWPFAIDAEGAGEGRAAITWWGRDKVGWQYRSVLVLVARGDPGEPIELAAGNLAGSLPRLAASDDGYVAVFHDESRCTLATCEFPVSIPISRTISFDGMLSQPKVLSANWGWDPDVVSDGRDFYVVWQDTLVKLGPDLDVLGEISLARGGALSIDGAELRVDAGLTSAVYSLDGDLLRFEPLPIYEEDDLLQRLSRGAFLVRPGANPRRLFIRRPDAPAPGADLAVVATPGFVVNPFTGYYLAMFRVVHRGGAPIARIELWSHWRIVFPDDPVGNHSILLERTLHSGDSFEFGVEVYPEYSAIQPRVWAAGDVLDANPANNVDTYERPLRPRARPAAR